MQCNTQRSTHRRLSCAMWCETRLSTIAFPVPLEIDWIRKQSASPKKNKKWNTMAQSQLDHLDFVDDLALLSHTQQQMQEKADIVAEHSARLRFNIQRRKSRILKVNSTSSLSHTGRGSNRRGRQFHISGQRR